MYQQQIVCILLFLGGWNIERKYHSVRMCWFGFRVLQVLINFFKSISTYTPFPDKNSRYFQWIWKCLNSLNWNNYFVHFFKRNCLYRTFKIGLEMIDDNVILILRINSFSWHHMHTHKDTIILLLLLPSHFELSRKKRKRRKNSRKSRGSKTKIKAFNLNFYVVFALWSIAGFCLRNA